MFIFILYLFYFFSSLVLGSLLVLVSDKARAATVTKEATEPSAKTGTKVEERQERHAVNSKVFAR